MAPVPAVMVSCGTGDRINIITVGWTGIINTKPPKTYVSIRPTRYSYSLIKESGEFVINLTPAALVKKADQCGMHTGAKVNKFKQYGLTPEKASAVSCPLIAECPVSLECKVTDIITLGTHDMFIADIIASDIDETLIDQNGKMNLDDAKLAAYAHGSYYELGKKLGNIGFSAKKNKGKGKAR